MKINISDVSYADLSAALKLRKMRFERKKREKLEKVIGDKEQGDDKT